MLGHSDLRRSDKVLQMNSIFVDPDIKINMSLDEIIRLTKDELNHQLVGKGPKQKRKRKNNARSNENSVSFLPSVSEVGNNVGVNHIEERKQFIQAVSNRGLNSDLLQKTKKIIPAEYKLMKTSSGVERVLVPVSEYYRKPQKKISKPRKLNKTKQNLQFGCENTLNEKPPPLMSTLIYDPPKLTENNNCMQVEESDDEVKEVCVADKKKNLQVIDLESDLPMDVIEAKKMCVVPRSRAEMKTLSERFTMLTGSFQF